MLKKKIMAALLLMSAAVFTPGMTVMADDSNVIIVANRMKLLDMMRIRSLLVKHLISPLILKLWTIRSQAQRMRSSITLKFFL